MAKKRRKLKINITKKKEKDVEKGVPGGIHSHEIMDGQATTEFDGHHSHLFIINGLPYQTECDGGHSHSVIAAENRLGPEVETHIHTLKIGEDAFETEMSDSHQHELEGKSWSTWSGSHRHQFEFSDGTRFTSLLPGDLLTGEVRKNVNLQIHQIIIDRSKMPELDKVTAFLAEKGFHTDNSEITDKTFIFRQLSRERFIESSLQELQLSDGVLAIVGILDPEQMGDLDNPSFDKLSDDIDPKEQVMSNEQVADLARLKDEFAVKIAELRDRLTALAPILNTFTEISEKIITNEAFQVFLTGFVDATQVMLDELGRIGMTLNKNVEGNFEEMLRKVRPVLKEMRETFEDSEGYENFGNLISLMDSNVDQMLFEVPNISKMAEDSELSKSFLQSLNLKDWTIDELEDLSVEEFQKYKLETFDPDEINNEKLTTLIEKFITADETTVAQLEFDIEKRNFYITINDKQTIEYDINKGIPLPENKFDKIIIKDCLALINEENKEQIIKEVHRVLKKGGEFETDVISTNCEYAFLPLYKSFWNQSIFQMFIKDSYLNKMFSPGIEFESDILKTETDEENGISRVVTKLRKPND